jgi:hypothetical protein
LAQTFCALVIGGLVLLVPQNLNRLLELLPHVSLEPKGHIRLIVAMLLVLVGLVGTVWRKGIDFFKRWSHNREAIHLDVLLVGATIGFVLDATSILISEGTWELRPNPAAGSRLPFVALALLAVTIARWRTLKKNRDLLDWKESAKPATFMDEPLPDLTPETDAFGRGNFVTAFAEAIQNSDPETCHIFGLVGAFGSGKTTVINAVSGKCQPTLHVIRIDSWAFRDTGRLAEAVLTSVVKEIDKRYLIPDLKRTLARYLSLISPAAKNVPILEALSKVLASAEDLQNLKRRIDDAIRATQDRLLVVVDDVDRLDASELQSLLKTVRLCASIPRIAYLLAYDRPSIYRLIAPGDASLACDFMDKVVEDEWVLPLIPHEKLRTYLLQNVPGPGASLHERFARDFDERLKENLPAIRQLLKTPRQVKRVGIALSRRGSIVRRLNRFDSFLWELLRQRRPLLYEYVSQRPWLIRPDAGLDGDWVVQIFMDKERRAKAIQEIDETIKKSGDEAESVGALFWTLFPKERPSSEGAEAEEIRLRRICNSGFFDAYFLLDAGTTTDRLEQIDTQIAALNKAVSEHAAFALASKHATDAQASGYLADWIALMKICAEDIAQERLPPIIQALCDRANSILNSSTQDAGSLARGLGHFNMQLLSRVPDTRATAVFEDMITRTENLSFAGFYITMLKKGQGWPRQGWPDEAQCLAAFDNRLEKELIDSGVDIFEDRPYGLATLILHYRNRQKLWNFLSDAANDDSKKWGYIVLNFVNSWSDGVWRINEDMVPLLPHPIADKASAVLKGADTTTWPEPLVQATRTFLEWRAQTNPPPQTGPPPLGAPTM